MKRKLFRETLIYCILPILIIGFFRQYYITPWIILIMGILYAFLTNKKENRLNYTFTSFLILFSVYFIIINGIDKAIAVQFNLAFVMIIAGVVLFLELIDRSLCKIAFRDIFLLLGETKMGIYKINKRSKIGCNLKKLSLMIALELIVCDLVGIYYLNIVTIGNIGYLISYEILIIIMFSLAQMYQISLIRDKIEYLKYKSKSFIKEDVDLGKVINLEHYR